MTIKPAFKDEQELRFIRAFLSSAGDGYEEWIDDTTRKLERGRETFGQYEYLNRSVHSMVNEIYEEAQDLGGWACVACMHLYAKIQDGSINSDEVGEALLLLKRVASVGAELSPTISRLRELMADD